MQLRDYYSILRRRWWLLVLLPVLGALAAYGFSKLQTPTYRSSLQMRVDISRPDYGLGMAATQQLRNLVFVVQKDEVYQKINDTLQLDLGKDKLRSMVKYSDRPEDLVILIDVDDTDASRAQAIAEQLGREFEERQLQRNANIDPNNRINVEVIDPPRVGDRISPKTPQNVVAGTVLGLIMALVLAGALEFLEDTLRGVEDVQRLTNLPIIGAIPPAGAGANRRGLPRLAGATGLFGVLVLLVTSTLLGLLLSFLLNGRFT